MGDSTDFVAGVSVTVVIPTVWVMVSIAVVLWLPMGIEMVWSPIWMVSMSSPFFRVAFQKFEHLLHADARDEYSAPFLAGPHLRDSNWARQLRLAVPKELNPDATMLVRADLLAFLAFLAHHLGGLDAVDAWPGRY